ncbi:site-specific integrase [Streptomyces sp. NEAU-Y11]|uniref:site-specific integrase n=1 Tax=Streptomyces cucumeris TaxID=2962890 RepID=UPI0020C8A074|nr:site-specific integrase [Streptomyces sp. NEAU-Y11]MCP9209953.1 tyrosine-type recombinase/integrase [Streptomyces sp. NEAU-Y11]
MGDPIKKITLKDGTTRYRFVVDIGHDANGKRKQLTVTKDTKTEAKNERARILHQRANGTLVPPSKMTVDELLNDWLKSATRDVEEGTAANYEDAVRPVRVHLGHKPLQEITEDDVESLIDWMLTSGRVRGGKAGTGLGLRSVQLTLGRLRSALHLAVRRQLVTRNVAEHVTIPRQARQEAKAKRAKRVPWTEQEVKVFLAECQGHRLHAAMLLLLLGLRPAEVCGMRWSEDVDLTAGTIQVETTRTMVRGKVVEKDPKSERGKRTLPLPAVVLGALRAAKAAQAKEKLAAGQGYTDSGRVVVDELGEAAKTDWLRRRVYKLMEAAGVRKVRPYDARHACLTWMATSGVPDVIVSAWAGHSDLSFTKRVYVHPDAEDLRAGADHMQKVLG